MRAIGFRMRLILLSTLGASIITALFIHVGSPRIISALKYANPLWILAALTLDVVFYLLKAARWRLIIGGMELKTSYRTVLNVTFIGYLANMLIPFRLGELGRAYALKRAGRVPLSLAILSIAVESLFDTMGMGFILGLSLLLMSETAALNAEVLQALKLLGCGGVILSLLLLIVPSIDAFREWMIRFAELLPENIKSRLKPLMLNYFIRLASLSHRGMELMLLWTLSAAMWIIPGLCIAASFKAFNTGMSMAKALLGSMLLQISFAVPAPPGYAGTFEAYWALIYRLLGYDVVESLKVGVAYHILNLVMATVLGGISIPCLNLNLTEAIKPRSIDVEEPS
ncbi:MAG: lysylphosphatidylglycerol synthase transmembrane domain-containing protein [Candidatus Bathyarchaeia archaeon]